MLYCRADEKMSPDEVGDEHQQCIVASSGTSFCHCHCCCKVLLPSNCSKCKWAQQQQWHCATQLSYIIAHQRWAQCGSIILLQRLQQRAAEKKKEKEVVTSGDWWWRLSPTTTTTTRAQAPDLYFCFAKDRSVPLHINMTVELCDACR